MRVQARCEGLLEGEWVVAVGGFCGWSFEHGLRLHLVDDAAGVWAWEENGGGSKKEGEYKYVVVGEHGLRAWELWGNRHFADGSVDEVKFPAVVFLVSMELQKEDEDVGGQMMITGGADEIGSWVSPRKMRKVEQLANGTKWKLTVPPICRDGFPYRYIYQHAKNQTTWWERDPDRWRHGTDPNGFVVFDDGNFHQSFEVSKIWGNLVMGPYPMKRSDVTMLSQTNVCAVFSVQTEKELVKRGVNKKALLDCYRKEGIKSYRCTIEDFNAGELQEKLYQGANLLHSLVQAVNRYTDGLIYVHCMSGISRSAAVSVLERCIATGRGYDDVFWELQRMRPQVSPNHDVVRWLVDTQKQFEEPNASDLHDEVEGGNLDVFLVSEESNLSVAAVVETPVSSDLEEPACHDHALHTVSPVLPGDECEKELLFSDDERPSSPEHSDELPERRALSVAQEPGSSFNSDDPISEEEVVGPVAGESMTSHWGDEASKEQADDDENEVAAGSNLVDEGCGEPVNSNIRQGEKDKPEIEATQRQIDSPALDIGSEELCIASRGVEEQSKEEDLVIQIIQAQQSEDKIGSDDDENSFVSAAEILDEGDSDESVINTGRSSNEMQKIDHSSDHESSGSDSTILVSAKGSWQETESGDDVDVINPRGEFDESDADDYAPHEKRKAPLQSGAKDGNTIDIDADLRSADTEKHEEATQEAARSSDHESSGSESTILVSAKGSWQETESGDDVDEINPHCEFDQCDAFGDVRHEDRNTTDIDTNFSRDMEKHEEAMQEVARGSDNESSGSESSTLVSAKGSLQETESGDDVDAINPHCELEESDTDGHAPPQSGAKDSNFEDIDVDLRSADMEKRKEAIVVQDISQIWNQVHPRDEWKQIL